MCLGTTTMSVAETLRLKFDIFTTILWIRDLNKILQKKSLSANFVSDQKHNLNYSSFLH